MDEKWKKMSLSKKIITGLLVALVGYNLMVNLHVFTGIISRLWRVLRPFVIGVAIAYLLARPVDKLKVIYEKRKSKFARNRAHTLAVIDTFLILILVVTGIVVFITPMIVRNVGDLIGNLDTYYADVLTWMNEIEPSHFLYSFLPEGDYLTSTELLGMIPSGNGDFDVVGFVSNSLMTVVERVVSITTGIVNFAMGLIIALYLLLYKKSVLGLVNRMATALMKPRALEFAKYYFKKSNEVFYKFISAQFLDACVLGTLATILLAFLGVEYAVTFGLLLGIFNMIPFFGSIIATIIVVIVTFFTGGMNLAALTFVSLLGLQQLDANFINPKITGDSLGLNPLLIVTSIFIGGAYLGVLGMFIGVPVGAMLKIFLEDFLVYRERKLGISKA